MNKYLIALSMTGMALAAPLFAQDNSLDLFKQIDSMDTPTPSPAPGTAQNPAAQEEPTVITATKQSTFDGHDKVVVLIGDVVVKNPQFTLKADKLTVYFNKDQSKDQSPGKPPGAKKEQSARSTPTPAATPKAGASTSSPQQGGGIEKAIAEGNVVIESERPDPNGGTPVHYVGKGDKMVYTAATGEAVLTGTPQIEQTQQGTNTIQGESSTVIYLYRDGRMNVVGPQTTNIHNVGPDKTPAPAKTPEAQ